MSQGITYAFTMNEGLSKVYLAAERFSRVAVIACALFCGLLHLFGVTISLNLQIVFALVALALGIPHGAIDHLISIPANPRSKFVAFIAGYVAIAILGGVMIATWNVVGFQLVVIMSSLHFGFGDASYENEWRVFAGQKKIGLPQALAYALPSGLLPVLLPLTDSRSLSALHRIHPALSTWAGVHTSLIRELVLALAVAGFLIVLGSKIYKLALDLLLIALLSLVAPPLLCFAFYFGCWHAIRHTARLVPKLPAAELAATAGRIAGAYKAAIVPGLYAIAGTLLVAGALMIWDSKQFGSGLLWSTLVIVWALTIPHMLTTASFDRRALNYNKLL